MCVKASTSTCDAAEEDKNWSDDQNSSDSSSHTEQNDESWIEMDSGNSDCSSDFDEDLFHARKRPKLSMPRNCHHNKKRREEEDDRTTTTTTVTTGKGTTTTTTTIMNCRREE